ncbi:hypothetical protein SAMN03159353_11371, partial [Cedecea sp. NFIX57]
MTKGKLRGIAKVVTEDCDLIDALMTKYSVYEHSQADELPLVPVELDEFEKDVLKLITWMNEFKTRIVFWSSLYINLCNCLILICSIQHQKQVNLWTKNSCR